MKIAVLFGSFNPLTNAHLAIMREAVAHLQADKGLFVATNGKYLERKTVKIGDPFYLTEQERRDIIEQACAGDEKLSFWGYELGGSNPRRYQTLLKIQKQYPDAQLFEIQGADKVHTLTKSASAPDYLRDIRFAVFAREGIDLPALLAADPLLKAHRDAFILLPAPREEADISSTLVRKRFYAGQDVSDLVPQGAVQVLSRHTPEDFSISFEDHIRVLFGTGRFGRMVAGKEVYLDNKRIFHQWQAGKAHLPLGDYRAFLDNTTLYHKAISVEELGHHYPTTQTGCINMDCAELALELQHRGYNPAILNLASAKRPGGGYDQGYGAQEESLCQCSTLSQSLYQFGDPKYKNIRESGVSVRQIGYPLDMHFGGIYTPNVTFFRHPKSHYFTLRQTPFQCDVITVAALSFTGKTVFCGVNEITYQAPDGGFTPEGEAIMLDKIRTIFRLGIAHGKDSLVLGAFGCGAYKLPAREVAALFRRVMDEAEFAGKLRLVTFAILEQGRKPSGLEGKFAPFYERFGTYTLT